ncbi:hypothetical protein [Roseobacter ponti]|uniref:Animal haem peroxidase n=1 Tax=Roseobacter ponti TaxID=1891787 RepID=A0A858SWA4_9RHOB|nr:hypothetical protein [Roseobacter ponti]QJF51146.1 hypothetical protein G3256_08230 [Roseobacter ponti]
MSRRACAHMHGGGLKLVADAAGADDAGAFSATLFGNGRAALAEVPVGPGPRGLQADLENREGAGGRAEVAGYSRLAPQEEETRDGPLAALAGAMVSSVRPAWPAAEPALPSAYVYFAQFLGHDLSRSNVSDPGAPLNLNTAALDLDTVFPPETEHLQHMAGVYQQTGALVEQGVALGRTSRSSFDSFLDLPRDTDGRPLTPDGRSDANLFLAQLHVALLRYYIRLRRDGLPDPEQGLIDAVHQITLYDFLPRIIDAGTLADVMANGRRLVAPGIADPGHLLIPAEFAFAAYRFGHPMVRDRYTWSRTGPGPHFMPQLLAHTFNGTSLAMHDEGHRVLSFRWEADWRDSDAETAANVAAPITPVLYHEMGQLDPGHLSGQQEPANLAGLTLARGQSVGLTSAQGLWQAHPGIFGGTLLTPEEIASEQPAAIAAALTEGVAGDRLCDRTPLWFYTLREAQFFSGGARLGPLAGRIVAETLHAAICAARNGAVPAEGTLTLPDLLGASAALDAGPPP